MNNSDVAGTDTMTCPRCNGRRGFTNFFDGVKDGKKVGWTERVPCSLCKGQGSITQAENDAFEARKVAGAALEAEHNELWPETPTFGVSERAILLGISTRNLLRAYSGFLTLEEAKQLPLSEA